MQLVALEVSNFRSIEHIHINDIERLNILIGRNNSGKSAVLNSVKFLSQVLHGNIALWEDLVSGGDTTKSIDILVRFSLDQEDRRTFISELFPHSLEKADELFNTSFARLASFRFKTVARRPQPLTVLLYEVYLFSSDGKMSMIGEMTENETNHKPSVNWLNIENISNSNGDFSSENFYMQDFNTVKAHMGVDVLKYITLESIDPGVTALPRCYRWLLWKMTSYFKQAFFFSPYRRSNSMEAMKETLELETTGTNLAIVLLTAYTNERQKFNAIESFMIQALPDAGMLHTRILNDKTQVQFKLPSGYFVPLQDMGGGVEQLLMVLTAFFLAPSNAPIFIEEPESHLHAGAQRLLLEEINKTSRQIFLRSYLKIQSR